MAKISLRGYNIEIDRLIDNNQLDEAIAHCIHILEIYPKHVDTYRLLGKAFLERQRYNDAAIMFMRVLAIYPDDFVAHIGISIVREEQADLDHAVFHMERAFEVQPTNTAIQDELKRLYGKRDGVTPAKIRLTHPALARLYSKGDLTQQALGELSVALSESPNRVDILAQLAELQTREKLDSEAIETCNKLIESLPYCFGALNVLTRLLPGTPSAQQTSVYQARINELDPYFEFKTNPSQPVSEVTEDAIMIEQLTWSSDSEVIVNKADWASEFGIHMVEPVKYDTTFVNRPVEAESYDFNQEATQPRIRKPVQIPADPEASSSELPDWMESAGWSKSGAPPDMNPSGEINEQSKTDKPRHPKIDKSSSTDAMSAEESEKAESIKSQQSVGDISDINSSDISPEMKKHAGDTGSLDPAASIPPSSIPDWLRSIAPPDLSDTSTDVSLKASGISDSVIDDAFSSIFPTSKLMSNKVSGSFETPPEPTPPVDEEKTSEEAEQFIPEETSPQPANDIQEVPEHQNSFNLDELRMEMEPIADASIVSDKVGENGSEIGNGMSNDDLLESLRNSFPTGDLKAAVEISDEKSTEQTGTMVGEESSVHTKSNEDELEKQAEMPAEHPEDMVEEVSPMQIESNVDEPQNIPDELSEQIEQKVEEESSTHLESSVEEPEKQAEEPTLRSEGEVPLWLRDLGDTKAETGTEKAPAAIPSDRNELPAWLQDFEQKIDQQPASEPIKPAVPAIDEIIKKTEPVQPDTSENLNIPEEKISESKFHTQELVEPPVTGLNDTGILPELTPEQADFNEYQSYKVQPEESPLIPSQTSGGGDTTIIAPISDESDKDEEEDDRPAWLSMLAGIDDIDISAADKSEEKPATTKEVNQAPMSWEDIPGVTQDASITDTVSGKDADQQAEVETSPAVEEPEAQPPVPEMAPPPVMSASEASLVQPEPILPTPEVSFTPPIEETPVSEPSVSEPVPDLNMIIDSMSGMSAAQEGKAETPALAEEPESQLPESEPDRSIPVVSPTASGEEPRILEPSDSEPVPDLSLIVEGLQAAWMSEHVEDAEIPKSETPMETFSPEHQVGINDTIVVRRPEIEKPVPEDTSTKVTEAEEEPEAVAVTAPPPSITKTEIPKESKPTPAPVSVSVDGILNDARAAFSHGVLDESLARYVELINRNRLIDDVIEDLEKMTDSMPDMSDVWQTLGDAYTRRNKLEQALSAYHNAENLLK